MQRTSSPFSSIRIILVHGVPLWLIKCVMWLILQSILKRCILSYSSEIIMSASFPLFSIFALWIRDFFGGEGGQSSIKSMMLFLLTSDCFSSFFSSCSSANSNFIVSAAGPSIFPSSAEFFEPRTFDKFLVPLLSASFYIYCVNSLVLGIIPWFFVSGAERFELSLVCYRLKISDLDILFSCSWLLFISKLNWFSSNLLLLGSTSSNNCLSASGLTSDRLSESMILLTLLLG